MSNRAPDLVHNLTCPDESKVSPCHSFGGDLYPDISVDNPDIVELKRLEHLWDHEKYVRDRGSSS